MTISLKSAVAGTILAAFAQVSSATGTNCTTCTPSQPAGTVINLNNSAAANPVSNATATANPVANGGTAAATVGNVSGGTATAQNGDQTTTVDVGVGVGVESTNDNQLTAKTGDVVNNTANNIVFKDTKQDYATPLANIGMVDRPEFDPCDKGEGRTIGFTASAVGFGGAGITLGRSVDKSSDAYKECVRANKEEKRQYTMFSKGGLYQFTAFKEWEAASAEDPKSKHGYAADEARRQAALDRKAQDAFFLATVPQAPTVVNATTVVKTEGPAVPKDCPPERIKYDAKTNTLICGNGLTR